jgi:hypothetical protein
VTSNPPTSHRLARWRARVAVITAAVTAAAGLAAVPALAAARPAAMTTFDPCTINRHDWSSVVTTSGIARIWWPKADPVFGGLARHDASDLDSVIWPKFRALLHVEPPAVGTSCLNGANRKLGIYLATPGQIPPDPPSSTSLGWEQNYPVASDPNGPRASFVVLYPDRIAVSASPERDALAHEVFHSFEDAFSYSTKRSDYSWFDEAAAKWAEEYAYPADYSGHYWPELLTDPGVPLDSTENDHQYDAWAYVLFLVKTLKPSVVGAIFTAFATHTVNGGIDAATGGFTKEWKKFALAAWNQTPKASFQQWDAFTDKPVPDEQSLALGGMQTRSVTAVGSWPLPHLARSYTLLTVTDKKLRYLEFHNTLAGMPDASVQAYVQLTNGQWLSADDWTDEPTISFCRDDPSQDVAKIVVIYGNSNFTATSLNPATKPYLKLSTTCPTKIRITGSFSWKAVGNGTAVPYQSGDIQTGTFTISAVSALDSAPTSAWISTSSSYTVTDTLHQVLPNEPLTGCTTTITGSMSSSGTLTSSWPPQATDNLVISWANTNPPWVSFWPSPSPVAEEVTTTVSGPSAYGCAPGTQTAPMYIGLAPSCISNPYDFGQFAGTFKGKNNIGTITISCTQDNTAGEYTMTATGTLTSSAVT